MSFWMIMRGKYWLNLIQALFFYLPGWIWGQVEGDRVANVVGEKVISLTSKIRNCLPAINFQFCKLEYKFYHWLCDYVNLLLNFRGKQNVKNSY